MKLILFFFAAFVFTFSLQAQQGRHELPIDTISIGGQEQEKKMTQLEGQNELENDLKSLRDSVTVYVTPASPERKNFNDLHNRLSEMIHALESSTRDETLMKEAQVLIKEARKALKSVSE